MAQKNNGGFILGGRYSLTELMIGVLMAFTAGSINAGGFLACQMFVSHVTGFATLFGVGIARMSILEGLSMLSVPLFFLMGALLAGLLTEVRRERGQRPRFDIAMGTVASLLVLSALLGHLEVFGVFGGDYEGTDYGLLAMLCASCGLQNGAVTIGSKSMLRATHLTGLTTDLGIDMARSLFGRKDRRRRIMEFYRTFERASMVGSFCLGSLMGAVLYVRWGFLGFLMPAALALITGILSDSIFKNQQGHHMTAQ